MASKRQGVPGRRRKGLANLPNPSKREAWGKLAGPEIDLLLAQSMLAKVKQGNIDAIIWLTRNLWGWKG